MADRYFAMLRASRGLEPVLYHGEFAPTGNDQARMHFACQLRRVPDDHPPDLDALVVWYADNLGAGTLPANLAGRA